MAGEMTVREAGRRGGEKRKAAGTDYAAMGRVGGATTRDRHPDHHSLAGKKGAAACLARYGKEHYRQAGAKGGQRVAELIRKGREAEQ